MFPSEIAISDDGRFLYVSNRDATTQCRDSVRIMETAAMMTWRADVA